MNGDKNPLPDTPISSFLSELRTNNTIMTYRGGIFAFLDWKFDRQRLSRKATPEEMKRYEQLARGYLSSSENFPEDVRIFAASMRDIPPKTASSRMTGVREFFLHYDIEFTTKQKRQIKSRMPQGGAWTQKGEFTPEHIRKILSHMPIHGKALILMGCSSGTRIGALLSLVPSNIPALLVPEETVPPGPVEVYIPARFQKNRQQRLTFISQEAYRELREWMKVRDEYLKSSIGRNAALVASGHSKQKKQDDTRIFPFTSRVAHTMWVHAIKDCGMDQKDPGTDRYILHFHLLRSFFRTQMTYAGVPLDIVEEIMGHEGYLTGEYRNYAKSQLREQYEKGEPFVTVLSDAPMEIVKTRDQIKEIKEDARDAKIENIGMRQKLQEIEKTVQAQSEVIELLLKNQQDEGKKE